MKFFPSESQRGGAGRSRALGRGLSCPCSCPEPTMRVHFVCIHFCLPTGTPAPCEGGVSQGRELAILLFLSTCAVGMGPWDQTGLLSFPGGCLNSRAPHRVLTQLLYFPRVGVMSPGSRRGSRSCSQAGSLTPSAIPGAQGPLAICTRLFCVPGQSF